MREEEGWGIWVGRGYTQVTHTVAMHVRMLEVKVEAQAGDKTWESLAELGWMRSLEKRRQLRASPTLGAQEEQLTVRN